MGEPAEVAAGVAVGEADVDLADGSASRCRIQRQADLEAEARSELQRAQQRPSHGTLARQRLGEHLAGLGSQHAHRKPLHKPEPASRMRRSEHGDGHIRLACCYRLQQGAGERGGGAEIGVNEQVDVGGA